MKLKMKQEVDELVFDYLLNNIIFLLVLFICMDSNLFRDFLLMAYDLDMINGEYVFVYLDIFRLMRFNSLLLII
jgi:hypothetical protein